MNELEHKVIEWAEQRGIFENSSPWKQLKKTEEEVNELVAALDALRGSVIQNDIGAQLRPTYQKIVHAQKDAKDAIGDIVVTLIIQAHMHGWSLEECLRAAYDEIKDRKGKMVDGVFVKEE